MTASASAAATAKFIELDLTGIALLLDVDGTLIDIAPTPDAVEVPHGLGDALARLLDRAGGALALVSGRPIAELDRLFAPLTLPAVGGHGAEMRLHDRETIQRAEFLPDAMRRQLSEARAFDPGIVCEDKGYSFTLALSQRAAAAGSPGAAYRKSARRLPARGGRGADGQSRVRA